MTTATVAFLGVEALTSEDAQAMVHFLGVEALVDITADEDEEPPEQTTYPWMLAG